MQCDNDDANANTVSRHSGIESTHNLEMSMTAETQSNCDVNSMWTESSISYNAVARIMTMI